MNPRSPVHFVVLSRIIVHVVTAQEFNQRVQLTFICEVYGRGDSNTSKRLAVLYSEVRWICVEVNVNCDLTDPITIVGKQRLNVGPRPRPVAIVLFDECVASSDGVEHRMKVAFGG